MDALQQELRRPEKRHGPARQTGGGRWGEVWRFLFLFRLMPLLAWFNGEAKGQPPSKWGPSFFFTVSDETKASGTGVHGKYGNCILESRDPSQVAELG